MKDECEAIIDKDEGRGERYSPQYHRNLEVAIEHWNRYKSIVDIVKDKDVLDIASGEGYGTNLLADYARTIVGVDISNNTIERAKKKYVKQNMNFKVGNVVNIPMDDNSVDVVISFETIEHIDEDTHKLFLLEIKRILKSDGMLIISTPNKLVTKDIISETSIYHVKEFYREEFISFLNNYFKKVDIYTQSSNICDRILKENSTNRKILNNSTNEEIIGKYLICICRDDNLECNHKIESIIFREDKEYYEIYRFLKEQFYYKSIETNLYLDLGQGYNEDNKISTSLSLHSNKFELYIPINKFLKNKVKGIRWDPLEGKLIELSLESIEIELENNQKLNINLANLKTNGEKSNQFYRFETLDPILYILEDVDINIISVTIKGELNVINYFNLLDNYFELKSRLSKLSVEINTNNNIERDLKFSKLRIDDLLSQNTILNELNQEYNRKLLDTEKELNNRINLKDDGIEKLQNKIVELKTQLENSNHEKNTIEKKYIETEEINRELNKIIASSVISKVKNIYKKIIGGKK